MNKTILYHDDARKALEKGMDILSEAVSITLGPKGRNVVLEKKYGSPQIINDGVTIAKEIELRDSIENTGVALIRQAASKTNDVAGDGTTTATVLAYAIVKEGLKNVAAGSNPIVLKKGINKAVKFVTQKIVQYSRPIESSRDISQVAAISAGNDQQIGLMISQAIQKVGKEGIIALEEGQSTETFLEIKEGMKFDKGFISPYFITDTARMEVIQENTYILITDKKITLIQEELLPVLEQVSKTGMSLLIIAEDIEKEALATIVVNKLRGTINVAAVRAPGFGDRRKFLLEDIAILTSGQVISEDTGLTLDKVSLSNLGFAKKVKVSKDSTTIIADSNKLGVDKRCEQIRKQISANDNLYEREKLQERLGKLSSGVAVIKVGAATETEMKDKKLRLEDAINATKAAVEEGIVPGGGSTYIHLSKELLSWAENNLFAEELVGALIVQKSLLLPLHRIASNAGLNGAVIVEKIKQSQFPVGYNIGLDNLVDMYNAGIVDPAKVTRSALQNAASIASMILTTECIIVDAS
uniref:Chaperonin GroEL, chloroplastic n=1 Tax=Tolypiocladia glomerulata TaxID=860646 RepID=A0A1Z1MV31_9FLOR|nr:60-kDa chaperonin [Tolypiocladia glomerulata]ARW69836.1 60-kDa chaperonin [Tolypiocladia glomerulata]